MNDVFGGAGEFIMSSLSLYILRFSLYIFANVCFCFRRVCVSRFVVCCGCMCVSSSERVFVCVEKNVYIFFDFSE